MSTSDIEFRLALAQIQGAKDELYTYNQTQFRTYESKVTGLYSIVGNVTDKIQVLNNGLANNMSSVSVTISDLRNVISDLGLQIKTVNDTLHILTTDDKTTMSGIVRLNELIDGLNGTYGSLFNSVYELENNVAGLQGQAATLTTNASDLDGRVSANTTSISSLIQTVANNRTASITANTDNRNAITNLTSVVSTHTTNLNTITPFVVMTGMIMTYVMPSAPNGWLLCDGSVISRTTYANLFSVVGTTFGVGDSSTTFKLPDLRGRSVVGSGTGAGLSQRTVGSSGGEEAHLITNNEIPSHSHAINDPGHTHTTAFAAASLNTPTFVGGSTTTPSTLKQVSSSSTTGITLQNTGGGMAMNIFSPFVVLNYIIKI